MVNLCARIRPLSKLEIIDYSENTPNSSSTVSMPIVESGLVHFVEDWQPVRLRLGLYTRTLPLGQLRGPAGSVSRGFDANVN